MPKYDIAVVGAGSGGTVAAELATKLGAKTVLIEKEQRLGGECLHFGCVPSKALIHAARSHWQKSPGEQANFSDVKTHIYEAIDHIEHSHDNDAYFNALGVTVLHGDVVFTGKRELKVGTQSIQAKKIIIATGSSPLIPPIEGIDSVKYLTNESIFSIDSLPSSLAVVGGGPIGCELGQAFAMLGSKVTIFSSSERLLPREEPEASEALAESMEQMGIKVISNAAVTKLSKKGHELRVTSKANDIAKTFKASHVLIATGRESNTPNGLASAGITTSKRGMDVNARLQTNNRHVYAIGDCNGGVQFTHAAGEQAAVALQHALFGFSKRNPEVSDVPWATFTTPEIAHIGETRQSLSAKNTSYASLNTHYGDIDKAVTEQANGWIELLVNKKGVILGATVLGPNASELINYIAHIKASGRVQDFSKAIQVYPTYGLALKQLATNFILQKYNSGVRKVLVDGLRKLRF